MSENPKNKALAINGGEPARKKADPPMFYGGLMIDEKEEQAVLEVLRSKKLFRYYGPYETKSKVAEFEKKFAAKAGTQYALGLNSCTSALLVALLASGVQPGDEVIIPAYTFVATAAAVVAANAIPVIAEIDDSFTIDPADVERKITAKTKVILPVHMRGAPCDMDAIMSVAHRHSLKVVEDTAQAYGSSYKGKPLGSFGNAGCFSFQYHKIITAGEGGAIVTDDKAFLNRAKALHDTGANWRKDDTIEDKTQYPVYPGFNMRMNELTGAIMLVQMEKGEIMLDAMKRYSVQIKETLRDIPGIQLRRDNDAEGDNGICVMFIAPSRERALAISAALKAEGIHAGTMGGADVADWHIYCNWRHILARRGNNDSGFPFSLSDRLYTADMCPKSLDLLRRVMHISISPFYSQEDIDDIIVGLQKVLLQI